MKILITGSTGLIGSALADFLRSEGHSVAGLVRSKPEPGSADVYWNPSAQEIDKAGLEGIDAVVHLAGESIEGRWTEKKKARIYNSRVNGAMLLSDTLADLEDPPDALISASAVGYYGDRGDEILKEDSGPGSMFLSEVCKAWEAGTEPAEKRGIRVVNTRFGIVLTPKGGALERMITAFNVGLGGKLGTGKQYVSWVAIDDLTRAISFTLNTDTLRGPINVTSPNPVTNEELTKTLGQVISRPTIMSIPAFMARLAFGEMADNTLLASARAIPAKLLAAGFKFQYPEIEAALRQVLGKQ